MLAKFIYAGVVFMGFFSIMNPFAGISIFLGLTSKQDEAQLKKTALHSVMTAFCIVLIFSLAGHFLLHFFGVTFTALRLAGGILVALIGYEMLQGKQSVYSHSDSDVADGSSIAITPLGIPLLAGPGVIITAMNFATGNFINLIITIFSFGLLCLITYFVFISGKEIQRILGKNSLKVITRMMGLILVVIGTQMSLEGVGSAIQEFQLPKYF